jgi:hypothetical protein
MEAYLIKKKLWKVVNVVLQTVDGKDAAMIEAELSALKKKRNNDAMEEARAELILHAEAGQLSHMRSRDPMEIWLTLQRVHRAAGFATSLALRRRFLTMKKTSSESMQTWIGRVKGLAFRLEEAQIDVSEQDIILALTMGLPVSYDAVIINFDATATELLTLDHVIARLLNEEARQTSGKDAIMETEVEDAAMVVTNSKGQNSPSKKGTSDVTCFWCDKIGHYKSDCPERLAYMKGKEKKKTSDTVMAVSCGSDSDDSNSEDVAF